MFNRVSSGRESYLKHVDKDGESSLLIVTTAKKGAPLSDYGERLLTNALSKTIPILGPWRKIVVVGATKRVSDLVKDYDADHVLLVGKTFSPMMARAFGVDDKKNMMGIPVEYSKRRWIVTPSLSLYGVGDTASWKQASLMGHLFRHLELLRTGVLGWDDVNEPCTHKLISNDDDWQKFYAKLERAKIVAIDTETTSLQRINNTILTVQFGFDGRKGYVLPVAHPDSPLSSDVLKRALARLKHYFERERTATHVYANAKFDLHQLCTLLGIRWYNHDVYDVLMGQHNLDENIEGRKSIGYGRGEIWSLERLCLESGIKAYEDSPIAKSDRDKLSSQPLKHVAKYGAIDVCTPIRLRRIQLATAKARSAMMQGDPYRNFNAAVVEVDGAKIQQLVFMERNGLYIDNNYLVELRGINSPVNEAVKKYTKALTSLPEVKKVESLLLKDRNIRAGASLFGKGGSSNTVSVFDAGKPLHKQMLFFDVLKLKPIKIGKSGTGAVDKAFKKKYEGNPTVKAFSGLEEAKKLASTIKSYYTILVRNPDNKDGAIRTTYSLWIKTGRISSVDPNLQNIPTRNKDLAKIVKRMFIARFAKLYLKRDYSAHEVRMFGVVSGDPEIAKTFWNGMQTRLKHSMQFEIPKEKKEWWGRHLTASDVHYQNYARFYNVDPLQVTKEQRDGIKPVIFGVTYGKGVASLAKDLKKSEEEAKEILELIFDKTFVVGGKWLKQTQVKARTRLIAPNILGGVRHLWGHMHIERHICAAMDRRGPNSIIQGPSSNIGLRGAYESRKLVWRLFESRGIELGYYQCNAVHDSTETECDIVNIPVVDYLQHHGFTTMVHRWMRDTFGVNMRVGFEMDCEIGVSLAKTFSAKRWDEQVDAVAESIKWGNENLGWELPFDAYMKRVKHNARIIFDLRQEEIKNQLRNREATTYKMLMNRDNCLKLGLIFDAPALKKREVKLDTRAIVKRTLLRELA